MKSQLSTDLTSANIQQVLKLLQEAPLRLQNIVGNLSESQLLRPVGPGERSAKEMLAHIIHCEALTAESIYLALMLKKPTFHRIHAERDLGKLLHLDQLSPKELFTYFKLRRQILLGVLEPLSIQKWSRAISEEGKQRKESVYWRARGQALHEFEHIADFENKLQINTTD